MKKTRLFTLVFMLIIALTSVAAVSANSEQMFFLFDVSIPDNTVLEPGQYFTKTWRVQNAGDCVWTRNYRLVFESGSQMGGSTVYLPTSVYPGQSIDISVNMQAPTLAGNYVGYWKMQNEYGVTFGTTLRNPLWVKVRVKDPYCSYSDRSCCGYDSCEGYYAVNCGSSTCGGLYPIYTLPNVSDAKPVVPVVRPVVPVVQSVAPVQPSSNIVCWRDANNQEICQARPGAGSVVPIIQSSNPVPVIQPVGNTLLRSFVYDLDCNARVLSWTIRNNTAIDWTTDNIDIAIMSGSEILLYNTTRWDLPYNVNRGGELSFSVDIQKWSSGTAATFAIVRGSEVLTSFVVPVN